MAGLGRIEPNLSQGGCGRFLATQMVAPAADQETALYWLALHLTPGLGGRNALKLIQAFGSPAAIFHASVSELRSVGIRTAVAQAVHSGFAFDDATDELRKVEAAKAQLVFYGREPYPARLKEITDPPILLYAIGNTQLLGTHQIGVVGTRRPTQYGHAVAERLCKDLALEGLTITSGMARGIDSKAHLAALDVGGSTIAVLGTGVDVVYPKENSKLWESICKEGLVISEFPMGATGFPQNFPIRNRIISGLSYGILVVEGAQYSGSLITARLAMEQNREVMAVPGSIFSKPSWGPNLLIKDGAKLVQEASDVIEEMPHEVRRDLSTHRNEAMLESAQAVGDDDAQKPLFGSTSAVARKILPLLRVDEATQADDLIRNLKDAEVGDVLSALSELELLGAIRQLPGKSFVRVWTS